MLAVKVIITEVVVAVVAAGAQVVDTMLLVAVFVALVVALWQEWQPIAGLVEFFFPSLIFFFYWCSIFVYPVAAAIL